MIALKTLGAVDLRNDGKEVSTVLAQPKRLALLVYLATARPRGFHSRDTLLALFWPESDDERARNSLRQALHHLRRSLGEAAIVGRGDREVGVDGTLVHCDAAAFDEAIEGRQWETAVELYRGDFLPGLFVQDAPDVERWLDDDRARRRRDASAAAWLLAEASEREGDFAAAERWARKAVEVDPEDESQPHRLAALLERARGAASREPRPATPPAAEPSEQPRAPDLAQGPGPRAQGPLSAPTTERRVPSAERPSFASERAPRWSRLALAAAAILALLAATAWLVGRREARAAPPTIAVLPFVNMSADPANEYLSDGMSEELLNLLAQVPGLQVAARTSSFTFKGKNVPVDSIGRVLRVRHVLEGSVRQAGDRVRITAQLIDAETGYHLWSDTFDARVEDVVAVQDSIGRVIVETLRSRLAGDVGVLAQRRDPADPEAHVSVLKGWRAFRQNTPEAYEAAVLHFQDAIRRDPDYGRGLAGLATVRMWQANFRYVDFEAGYAEAESLATRALALDSSLTEAYAVLGRIAEARDRDDASADRLYARAIEINPNEPRAYSRRGALLVRAGRTEEGIALAKRAVELDPASPAVHADLANIYLGLNRFAEAESALRAALSLDPGHPILLGNLALVLFYQEKYEEAGVAIVEARAKSPRDVDLVGKHAFIHARLGRADAARATLDTAIARGLSPVQQASVLAYLGDRDRALSLLEEAVEARDDRVVALLDAGIVPELRDEPRMQRIIERVRGMQR
ncbi:MAG TPA: tetratricopeptide repeat protein [Gemmatimonadaceae bacterium]